MGDILLSYIVLIQLQIVVHNSSQFELLMFGTGYLRIPHVITADTVASFVKGIDWLAAHLLVPAVDCSDCSFFSLFFVAGGHIKCFS